MRIARILPFPVTEWTKPFPAALLAALLAAPWARAQAQPERPASSGSVEAAALPRETEELAERGRLQYGRGRALAWTGVGLVPVGLLALVPVWKDGAFGITAADPGIGGSLLALGGALVMAGIPLMGHGAGRMEEAALDRDPAFAAEASGWGPYRQSWLLIGAGGALMAAGLPFGIVAALDVDKQRPAIGWIAGTLLYGGAALGGAGILEQYYGGYRFARSYGKARRSLESPVSVSLHPLLRPGPGGFDAGGFQLSASF